MSGPVLHDAVTLMHLAVAQLLDVCRQRHAHRGEPRWTTAIEDEVTKGLNAKQWYCQDILKCGWLGAPAEPTTKDLKAILLLQRALNSGLDPEPPTSHLGEAEAIHFARANDGVVATDDHEAFEFARAQLGDGRAIDFVGILRSAVAAGDLTKDAAATAAKDVSDAGRSIRRVHPPYPDAAYFDY